MKEKKRLDRANQPGVVSLEAVRKKAQTDALQSVENIDQLIAEAKAITAAEKYLEEKNEEERQAAVKAFLRGRGEIFLDKYGGLIPQALHEYCQPTFTGCRRDATTGQLEEQGWLPDVWTIDAPNLAAIEVLFSKQGDNKYHIWKLEVGDHTWRLEIGTPEDSMGERYISADDDAPYVEGLTELWSKAISYAAEIEENNQAKKRAQEAWAAICWECRLDSTDESESDGQVSPLRYGLV